MRLSSGQGEGRRRAGGGKLDVKTRRRAEVTSGKCFSTRGGGSRVGRCVPFFPFFFPFLFSSSILFSFSFLSPSPTLLFLLVPWSPSFLLFLFFPFFPLPVSKSTNTVALTLISRYYQTLSQCQGSRLSSLSRCFITNLKSFLFFILVLFLFINEIRIFLFFYFFFFNYFSESNNIFISCYLYFTFFFFFSCKFCKLHHTRLSCQYGVNINLQMTIVISAYLIIFYRSY